MFIKQIYTSCLSEAAYFIESEGDAVVIDPLRDIGEYLALARKQGATICYIFETHFHADFVSGHLELQKETGAPIVYGPRTETHFPAYIAKDGEIFKIGKITLEVLHTPGHTLESVCYLLKDENGKPHALFTGDTLFIGDVGRPDLSSGNLSSEELAGMLFESVQKKILPLPDDVLVYPAHGPGSSCGKNLGPETYGTIGAERKFNYALLAADKEHFIKSVIEGLDAAPAYFKINARMNKEGYGPLEEILRNSLKPFSVKTFKERISQNEDLFLLDTRLINQFMEDFIPGSVFIGLEGRFAEWAASLLPYDQEILLIAEPGKEEETVVRLARVGFDRVCGYLDGGFASWKKAGEPIDMIISVDVSELAMDLPYDDKLVVVDVRKENEFVSGHVANAVNIPLGNMTDLFSLALFEESDNLYIHCGSGYRSMIACSLFKKQGYHNLRNVLGGWNAIQKEKSIQIRKEADVLN